MNARSRHKAVFAFFRPFCTLFAKLRFHYSCDSLKNVEGPYLLLSNHNLELDPVVIGISAWHQIYFVASEHLTRKGWISKLLMRYLSPIIHQKGRMGIRSTMNILKTLRAGCNVCLFPEGNRSFNGLTMPIPPATAKLMKKCGTKVITYRLEGSYLSNPRWSTTVRRGRVHGRLIHIYTPQELQAMTDEEVYAALCRDLQDDAYETQRQQMIPFQGKKLAEGLETTIFACPDCRKIGTLSTQDDQVRCTCGFHAVYDVYGFLHDDRSRTYTVTDLDRLQRQHLQQLVDSGTAEPLFSDQVTLQEISVDDKAVHSLVWEETGTLTAYVDRWDWNGKPIFNENILSAVIYSRNSLVMHTRLEGRHFEFKGSRSFSALKYQYLFEMTHKEA